MGADHRMIYSGLYDEWVGHLYEGAGFYESPEPCLGENLMEPSLCEQVAFADDFGASGALGARDGFGVWYDPTLVDDDNGDNDGMLYGNMLTDGDFYRGDPMADVRELIDGERDAFGSLADRLPFEYDPSVVQPPHFSVPWKAIAFGLAGVAIGGWALVKIMGAAAGAAPHAAKLLPLV